MKARARPDWAYDFPDRTGPDTQICRTQPNSFAHLNKASADFKYYAKKLGRYQKISEIIFASKN